MIKMNPEQIHALARYKELVNYQQRGHGHPHTEEIRILRERFHELTVNSENDENYSKYNIPSYSLGNQHAGILASGQSATFTGPPPSTSDFNRRDTDTIECDSNDIEMDGGEPTRSTVEPVQDERDLHAITKSVFEDHKRKHLYTDKSQSTTHTTTSSRPKFRAYSDVYIREKSFHGWQSDCIRPTNKFAQSGFFYKGFGDITACYQCGFMHKKWARDDDPIKTHLQFQPNCHFIIELTNKGIYSCDSLTA